MAQVIFSEDGTSATVQFAEEETLAAKEATRRDRDWLQNLIVEAVRVHARNFAEEELQQRIAAARVPGGKFGQFGHLGAVRLG